MTKYRVEPDDPEVIEAMTLGALMILELVENADKDGGMSLPENLGPHIEPEAQAIALGALAVMEILKKLGTFEGLSDDTGTGAPPEPDNEKDTDRE
jgi:hypothetical protein